MRISDWSSECAVPICRRRALGRGRGEPRPGRKGLGDTMARAAEPLPTRPLGRTPSGIEIPLVAGPGHHRTASEGEPGQWPFTRGIFPDGYTGRTWTMRQYSGFGTAEESNARYKFLLESGQTGLSVALDLPTQCGYDPVDPIAGPEIGKVGVSLSNLSEME